MPFGYGTGQITTGQIVDNCITKIKLDSAMFNAANGIASLDAAAKFAGLLSTSLAGVFSSDTYVGNDSANRAIPHGLDREPVVVFITDNVTRLAWLLGAGAVQLNEVHSAAGSVATVTAKDATNFYVGNAANYTNSMNLNPSIYYWVAIG